MGGNILVLLTQLPAGHSILLTVLLEQLPLVPELRVCLDLVSREGPAAVTVVRDTEELDQLLPDLQLVDVGELWSGCFQRARSPHHPSHNGTVLEQWDHGSQPHLA